jgi:hypothetical protein
MISGTGSLTKRSLPCALRVTPDKTNVKRPKLVLPAVTLTVIIGAMDWNMPQVLKDLTNARGPVVRTTAAEISAQSWSRRR